MVSPHIKLSSQTEDRAEKGAAKGKGDVMYGITNKYHFLSAVFFLSAAAMAGFHLISV